MPAITGSITLVDDGPQQGLVIFVGKTVAGVRTTFSHYQVQPTYRGVGLGAGMNFRFLVARNMIKVRWWDIGDDSVETSVWGFETEDSSLPTGNGFGLFADHYQGDALIAFSNVNLTPPQFWFDSYEIQRQDDDDPNWNTIMKSTSSALTSFNDYEARAGIRSQYRIRQSYVYGFPGPWSAAVSGMVPAPGVTGDSVNGHLLMFTTNEDQTGGTNAAYASVWENGTVTEDFTFPEADFVQLQPMFDRDFYTAFRPTERGGEQFTREVLVQAMAISPARLANFTTLRNLAFDSVNYICVRDEDGNRWLASVQVPSGKVQRRRTIYLATIKVVEVTETPTPVNAVWAP